MHEMTPEEKTRFQRGLDEAADRWGRAMRNRARIRSANNNIKDAIARYERKYQQAVERQQARPYVLP
jgi:hypothetical protein